MPESNLDFITILMLLIVIIVAVLIILNINKVNNNKNNTLCNQMENIESVGKDESPIPVPTDKQIVNPNQTQLSLYYTNWCGYSRQFFPEWEKIQNSDLKDTIKLISYDCDKSNQCTIDNVNGFPSLILHKNGQQIKFPDNLERNAENVISFVKNEL